MTPKHNKQLLKVHGLDCAPLMKLKNFKWNKFTKTMTVNKYKSRSRVQVL